MLTSLVLGRTVDVSECVLRVSALISGLRFSLLECEDSEWT